MSLDIESLLDSFIQIPKDNLNDKITEIQTEKTALLGAENFDVSEVGANAYFDQLDTRIANFDPFIYYGISEMKANPITSASFIEVSIFCLVIFADNFEDANAHKKALRYTRALSEIYQENFDRTKGFGNYTVSQLIPESTKFNDGAGYFKTGGILANFTLYN